MRYALMAEGQEGITCERLLNLARAAESAGFEAFFRCDHWLSIEGHPQRAATDAWTTIAGLARNTTRIRLGTLVSPVTFRHPVAIAKVVATADQMSGGRIELGLGAGWSDPEHETFGLAYPPMAERFDWLEEQLQVVLGLWTEPRFSFAGRHYRLREAICEPRPVQRPHPPLIVGGYGRPRTVRLAARYADELNLDSPAPEDCSAALDRLAEACHRPRPALRRSVGHDPLARRRRRGPARSGPRLRGYRRAAALSQRGERTDRHGADRALRTGGDRCLRAIASWSMTRGGLDGGGAVASGPVRGHDARRLRHDLRLREEGERPALGTAAMPACSRFSTLRRVADKERHGRLAPP